MADEALPETIARLDVTMRELASSVRQLGGQIQQLTGTVELTEARLRLQIEMMRLDFAKLDAKLEANQLTITREIAGLRSLLETSFERILGNGPRAREATGVEYGAAEAAREGTGAAYGLAAEATLVETAP